MLRLEFLLSCLNGLGHFKVLLFRLGVTTRYSSFLRPVCGARVCGAVLGIGCFL
jgi:hypothetical protein